MSQGGYSPLYRCWSYLCSVRQGGLPRQEAAEMTLRAALLSARLMFLAQYAHKSRASYPSHEHQQPTKEPSRLMSDL
jgi:hypothetical protein